MDKILNKRADMTSKELVGLVILIVSIAVIFIFLMILKPWSEQAINKETCHESIVLRSTYNSAFFETNKIIPLKCQTEKICLSSGEECIDFKADTKVSIKKDPEEARDQILDTIANSMYDCHSMLGEGKLGFMPNTKWTENYCLICSRFVLDNRTKQKVSEIGYGELYRYLGEKKTPDGRSYLDYIYPGWKNWEESKKVLADLQTKSNDPDFRKLKFEDWKINLTYDGGYAIVGQIAPKGTIGSILAGVGTGVTIVVVAALSSTGIGIPAAVAVLGVAGASGGAMFVYTNPTGKFEYTSPYILPYDVGALRSLKCSSFETAP